MIELKTKDGLAVQDSDQFHIYLHGQKGSEQAAIELTGKDLKKLVMLLNLSIGNLPENAPDITGLVDNIFKGTGFEHRPPGFQP